MLYSETTMFTDQQLEQFKELLRPINDKLDKQGRKLDEQGKSLDKQGKSLDEQGKKLDTLELKIEAVNARTERIEKTLDKEVTDLAEMQGKILMKLDKLDDHEVRITQLEEDAKFLPH